MSNSVWRAFNAGVNFVSSKAFGYLKAYGRQKPLGMGRFRIAALRRICRPETIRPAIVQECLRLREEIINSIKKLGPVIQGEVYGRPFLLIDITDEVKEDQDYFSIAMTRVPQNVDWSHFKDRIKNVRDYAVADVDLVVFTMYSSGSQLEGNFDYFYSDKTQGKIRVVVNKRKRKHQGMIYSEGNPGLRIQQAKIEGKKPWAKAYPVSLASTVEFLSELAPLLNVKPIKKTSLYWPVE